MIERIGTTLATSAAMAAKKNSLVANINRRKKSGKSRPKSRSTISGDAYEDMQRGWPESGGSTKNATKKAAKKGSTKKAAKKGSTKKGSTKKGSTRKAAKKGSTRKAA